MAQQERIRKKVVNNFFGNIKNYYADRVTYNAPVYDTGEVPAATEAFTEVAVAAAEKATEKAEKATGRPLAEELASCFRQNVDAADCIERMRPYIVGQKGKQVVLVLKAACRLQWFQKMPIFPQLVREYGALGRPSGFGEQMRTGYFSDEEVEGMMNKLIG
ncbi:MAG: hypothetical protein IJ767_07395 [Bacteroidaceae bacterium]|nr:hypothetical protein [Bacteroidaceae bacterium]